jgi:PTH2 family peptidyl-tRNA hydrolase
MPWIGNYSYEAIRKGHHALEPGRTILIRIMDIGREMWEWEPARFRDFVAIHYFNFQENMMTDPRPIKQTIVVRKDLNMRKGKIGAQVAHASMKVLLDMAAIANWLRDDDPTEHLCIPLFEEIRPWLTGNFRKIVLGIDSEAEMLELLEKAKAAGLYTTLVTDNGLTEFNGVHTNTCIAIGPNYDDRINPLTAHLKPL